MNEKEMLNNMKGVLGVLQTALLATASKVEDDSSCFLFDDICRGIRTIMADVEADKPISPIGWNYIKRACEEYNKEKHG